MYVRGSGIRAAAAWILYQEQTESNAAEAIQSRGLRSAGNKKAKPTATIPIASGMAKNDPYAIRITPNSPVVGPHIRMASSLVVRMNIAATSMTAQPPMIP